MSNTRQDRQVEALSADDIREESDIEALVDYYSNNRRDRRKPSKAVDMDIDQYSQTVVQPGTIEIQYDPYDISQETVQDQVDELGQLYTEWANIEEHMPHTMGWGTFSDYASAETLLKDTRFDEHGLYQFCDQTTFRGGRDGVFIQAAANQLDTDVVILPDLDRPDHQEPKKERIEIDTRLSSFRRGNLEIDRDTLTELIEEKERLTDEIKQIQHDETTYDVDPITPDRFRGIGHKNESILILEGEAGQIGWHNKGTIIHLQEQTSVDPPNNGEIYRLLEERDDTYLLEREDPELTRTEKMRRKLGV